MRSLLPSLGALGLVVSLTACGGGDAHTEIEPLSASTSATSPTADPATAVKTAVAAYLAAVTRLTDSATPEALHEVATPAWATTFVDRYQKNLVAHGLRFVGSNKLVSAIPQISGDEATVDACVDGTHVFALPKGQTQATSGDLPSPRAHYTYTLRLQDGHWLVDGLTTGGKPC